MSEKKEYSDEEKRALFSELLENEKATRKHISREDMVRGNFDIKFNRRVVSEDASSAQIEVDRLMKEVQKHLNHTFFFGCNIDENDDLDKAHEVCTDFRINRVGKEFLERKFGDSGLDPDAVRLTVAKERLMYMLGEALACIYNTPQERYEFWSQMAIMEKTCYPEEVNDRFGLVAMDKMRRRSISRMMSRNKIANSINKRNREVVEAANIDPRRAFVLKADKLTDDEVRTLFRAAGVDKLSADDMVKIRNGKFGYSLPAVNLETLDPRLREKIMAIIEKMRRINDEENENGE